jgi:hypothetical protein
MVNKYGDKYGLSDLASQINDNGKVACTAVKKQILDLRKDPELCSLMAAEMAADNKAHLEKTTGREAGATELYMAHFMGPAGASKFLNALDKNPNSNAAALFPDAASANKNVFFDKSGKSKTLEQVYAQFDKKFESLKAAETVTPVETAQAIDIPTENVLAALTPRIASPLYTNSSSLYTNIPSFEDDVTMAKIPNQFYSMISPIDILELLKNGYTGYKTNA